MKILALVLLCVVLFALTRRAMRWIQPDPAARASENSTVPLAKSDAELKELLEKIREKHKLPALAAAVVRGDEIIARAAVGVRVTGGTETVTLADRWHIGSCTKSMTATLAAMLVEEGKISWTTTVDEMFPELAEKMQPAYRSVTLEQLLAHRGGLPDDTKGGTEVFLKLRQLSGPIVEQRLKLVELALQQKPKDPPGTKYGYSNYGYAIAGAMIEKTTGRSWEELLQERLFKPLKMSSAGFGAPGRENPVDEPRGHVRRLGKLIPIKPGPNGDNPACMGPCGTVHCSIEDLARYSLFHLQGARGRNHILEPKSFQKLHGDIEKQGYALGWGVVERSWADGEALTHTGSNTMWFTVVWIAPKKDFAVVIATNTGQPDAFNACDAVAWQTIEKQLIKPAKAAN